MSAEDNSAKFNDLLLILKQKYVKINKPDRRAERGKGELRHIDSDDDMSWRQSRRKPQGHIRAVGGAALV